MEKFNCKMCRRLNKTQEGEIKCNLEYFATSKAYNPAGFDQKTFLQQNLRGWEFWREE